MNRITAIEKSLTAFVCGIVGFLPIIGFLPAICALLIWRRVHFGFGKEWNPASGYLHGGVLLALIGLASTGLIVASMLLVALSS